MTRLCLVFAFVLAGLQGSTVAPNESLGVGPGAVVPWVETEITLDGDPREAAWKTTTGPVRLLWDREHLYFYGELAKHQIHDFVVLKPSSEMPGTFAFR